MRGPSVGPPDLLAPRPSGRSSDRLVKGMPGTGADRTRFWRKGDVLCPPAPSSGDSGDEGVRGERFRRLVRCDVRGEPPQGARVLRPANRLERRIRRCLSGVHSGVASARRHSSRRRNAAVAPRCGATGPLPPMAERGSLQAARVTCFGRGRPRASQSGSAGRPTAGVRHCEDGRRPTQAPGSRGPAALRVGGPRPRTDLRGAGLLHRRRQQARPASPPPAHRAVPRTGNHRDAGCPSPRRWRGHQTISQRPPASATERGGRGR